MNDNLSRRTITRGAAWSIPAISLMAVAPAFAASAPPIKLTYLDGQKCPGGSGLPKNRKAYIFRFQADSAPAQGSITVTSVTVNGVEIGVDRVTISGTTVYVVTKDAGNSADASGDVAVTYLSGMPQVSRAVLFTYDGTAPAHDLCGNPNI